MSWWLEPTTDPSTGNTTFPGAVRTIIRGQSVRSDGNLFTLGPNTSFTNTSAETDCFTAPVAGLVDGAYALDSADDGMPPIIRAGFMIPAGREKSQGLKIHAPGGINFQAATASASTIASKLTLNAYLINLSTLVRVKIASLSVLASQVAHASPTTSLPCDFSGTITLSSIVSGTTWNVRNHDFVLVSTGGYGANFGGFKEQYTYPVIDWGVDQGLVFTQACDGGYPFGAFFFDMISVGRI